MAEPIGVMLRIAAVVVVAITVVGCVAGELPSLGSGPPAIRPAQMRGLGAAPVKGADVSFALQPLTNAPGAMLYAFEDAVKAAAPTRGLKLVPKDDPSATYRLKGYLSSVGDASGALVVCVWDVFDTNGNLLHRFTGQAKSGGSKEDPWANVKSEVVELIARETIDELSNWVSN